MFKKHEITQENLDLIEANLDKNGQIGVTKLTKLLGIHRRTALRYYSGYIAPSTTRKDKITSWIDKDGNVMDEKETAKKVRAMMAKGDTQTSCAKTLGISMDVMRTKFAKEVDQGCYEWKMKLLGYREAALQDGAPSIVKHAMEMAGHVVTHKMDIKDDRKVKLSNEEAAAKLKDLIGDED